LKNKLFWKKKNKILPKQERPSPEYSGLQIQLKLPIVFEQIAFISHPPLLIEHSLISTIFIWVHY